MNKVFHRRKSYIFIATGDVILTSYLLVCKWWVLPTGFTAEDKQNACESARVMDYGAIHLCKMFPDRQWNVDGV